MRLIIAEAVILGTLVLVACGDGGSNDAAPTASPVAVDPNVVHLSVTTGCDRPEPERGSEALALVKVTWPDGSPVIGAQVEGDLPGEHVAIGTASDATTLEGEALLFFAVSELGTYTANIGPITLLTGEQATIDPSSPRTAAIEVSEVCTPP